MGNGITWYDVLEVQPGASPDEIQYAYDSKTSLLRPEIVAGAPSMVLDAVARGQRILDEARRVLGDPGNRERYDAYLRTGGTGIEESAPSDLDRLAPRQDSWQRITVPDLRGLFYSVPGFREPTGSPARGSAADRASVAGRRARRRPVASTARQGAPVK